MNLDEGLQRFRRSRAARFVAAVGIGLAVLIGWCLWRYTDRTPAPPQFLSSLGNETTGREAVIPLLSYPRLLVPAGSARCTGNQPPVERSRAWLQELPKIARQLSAASKPLDRALGLSMSAMVARNALLADWMEAFKGCSDFDCRVRVGEAFEEAALQAPAYDALVKLASASDDPAIYAIAYRACHPQLPNFGASTGYCALLSAARWAQLDPQNAYPWLYAAFEAKFSGDTAAQDDAFYRASLATTFDSYPDTLLPAFDTDAFRSESPTVQFAIAQGIYGHTFDGHSDHILRNFCSATAVADPNRWQICGALVGVLSGADDPSWWEGAGFIGQTLGMPAERLAALRDRLSTYGGALPKHVRETCGRGAALSEQDRCELAVKCEGWIEDASRYGPVGAHRRESESGG
jgi:hypothetical protein